MLSTNEKEQSTDNSHSSGWVSDTAVSQIGKDRDTAGDGEWLGGAGLVTLVALSHWLHFSVGLKIK